MSLPRVRIGFLAAAAILALGACDDKKTATELPKPFEVTEAAVGHYCGMQLVEHAGPKGQIFVAGKHQPVWFSSVRDTFAFTMLPEEPKTIVAIYVNDMGKATSWEQPEAGTWIEARKAVFVIGSRQRGGMGAEEAVPFGEERSAQAFVERNGGRAVRFEDVPRDYILSANEAPAGAMPPASH